jgi:hypothetical protein
MIKSKLLAENKKIYSAIIRIVNIKIKFIKLATEQD